MEVVKVSLPLIFSCAIMTMNNLVELTADTELSIKEIVTSAISIDNAISMCLRYPKKADRLKINKYIKSYIAEVEKIVVKLMVNPTELDSEVKDFIKEGGAKFLTLPIEMGHLEDSFHWDEKKLKEYKTLRERTRDVWMKVNMLSESSTSERPL